jgi:hypothetical protein
MKKALSKSAAVKIALTFILGFIFIVLIMVAKSSSPVSKYVPEFSAHGGFYSESLELQLMSVNKSADIRYTLNGAEPDASSKLYDLPITIGDKTLIERDRIHTEVVRAAFFNGNKRISNIVTNTYIFTKDSNNRFKMPVVAITTDPDNFYDYETGIYVRGRVFDEWRKLNSNEPVNGSTPANYNQRGREWERPVHVQFFEPDGTLHFSQNAGIRTMGGWSRAHEQKSLRLFARSEYDEKSRFDHAIFPGLQSQNGDGRYLESFKRLVLRNSGNDFYFTTFRDAMMQKLAEDAGFDTQAYRPAVVFINGNYWGIQNLREDNDKYYVQDNYGGDADRVIIMSGVGDLRLDDGVPGDEKRFYDMLGFAWNADLAIEENYKKLEEMMDIDNFMRYVVFQIFYANTDWPHNNVQMWSYRRDGYEPDAPYGLDGRWRYMLKDTDFGFSLYGVNYNQNNLQMTASANSRPVPLGPLLKNEGFRRSFINYFADMLNTSLSTENMLEVINAYQLNIAPEIKEHIFRWNLNGRSLENWDNNVSIMRTFAKERPEYMRGFIKEYFNLEATVELEVTLINGGGTVKINTLEIDEREKSWKGTYFTGVPIELSAQPKQGYSFAGWTVDGMEYINDSLVLEGDTRITANFIKIEEETVPEHISIASRVVINEIMSSGHDYGETDWIELYNPTEESISLRNYYLSDNKRDLRKWQFSAVTLQPKQYLQIWCSGRDLRNPLKELHTNFKIKFGETLYLTYFDGRTIIDSVEIVSTHKNNSYGRYPDGAEAYKYMRPTPGTKNLIPSKNPTIPSAINSRIMVDGEILEESTAPIIIDNIVYASLNKLSKPLKLIIDSSNLQAITVIAVDRVILLSEGSNLFLVEGNASFSDGKVKIIDGEVYVPIRFFIEKLHRRYYWSQKAESVIITK